MYPALLESKKKADRNWMNHVHNVVHGDPTFLPIFLSGGIGDGILSLTTIQRLKEKGFQVIIYSHHAEALRYFYQDQMIFKGEMPDFTWQLHLDSVARFKMSDQFSGFLMPEHEKLCEQQQQLFHENPKMAYLIKIHPSKKFLLTEMAEERGYRAATFPIYTLGYRDIDMVQPWSRKPYQEYITIHDGFDIQNAAVVSGRCTKTWKWEHWNQFVYHFKREYPLIRVIQLGASTSRPIDGVDECLINKTTIHEAFDLISESIIHVDTDSGLVHAATQMGVPCVTIYGPTPLGFYGHAQNINLSSSKSCSGNCFFVTDNWMDRCAVGYTMPQCMDDVTPDQVFEAVVSGLAQR